MTNCAPRLGRPILPTMNVDLRSLFCTLALMGGTLAQAQGPRNAVAAFPTAEGFGAYATGGRGGKVLFVDSLEDDPHSPAANTFRWACETRTGPRIVVFRTGGVIELARTIDVVNGDVTIAAQTAPGSGICLKGSGL